jgi:hypothetical protein
MEQLLLAITGLNLPVTLGKGKEGEIELQLRNYTKVESAWDCSDVKIFASLKVLPMQRREIFKISHFSSAGWTDMYCGCS